MLKLNNKGFMNVKFVLIIGLMSLIVLEVYRDYSLHRMIRTELERYANMSVSLSLTEDVREGYAIINQDVARNTFNAFLASELGVNGSGEFGDGYELVINSINIIQQPPRIEIEGVLKIRPFFFPDDTLKDLDIELPFKVRSITQYTGY